MTPILKVILKLIYRDGIESYVTLIAHGKTMRGYLTASDYYAQWQNEALGRAALGQGKFRLPSTELDPPSDTLIDDIKARWPEREANFAAYPELADTLYLRNAKVSEPHQPANWNHPFLVVRASAVTAFAFGMVGTSARASSA